MTTVLLMLLVVNGATSQESLRRKRQLGYYETLWSACVDWCAGKHLAVDPNVTIHEHEPLANGTGPDVCRQFGQMDECSMKCSDEFNKEHRHTFTPWHPMHYLCTMNLTDTCEYVLSAQLAAVGGGCPHARRFAPWPHDAPLTDGTASQVVWRWKQTDKKPYDRIVLMDEYCNYVRCALSSLEASLDSAQCAQGDDADGNASTAVRVRRALIHAIWHMGKVVFGQTPVMPDTCTDLRLAHIAAAAAHYTGDKRSVVEQREQRATRPPSTSPLAPPSNSLTNRFNCHTMYAILIVIILLRQ